MYSLTCYMSIECFQNVFRKAFHVSAVTMSIISEIREGNFPKEQDNITKS